MKAYRLCQPPAATRLARRRCRPGGRFPREPAGILQSCPALTGGAFSHPRRRYDCPDDRGRAEGEMVRGGKSAGQWQRDRDPYDGPYRRANLSPPHSARHDAGRPRQCRRPGDAAGPEIRDRRQAHPPQPALDLARVLEVPISYFFDEVSASTSARPQGRLRLAEQKPPPPATDPMAKQETLELVGAYCHIVDPDVRKCLFNLIKALG